MKLRRKIEHEIIWRLLWAISTGIAVTLRLRVRGDKEMLDLFKSTGGILVTWHGVTVIPIYYCRHRGYWTLISPSRDGEIQNKLVKSRGFHTIRGSSSKSGIKAMLEAIRQLRSGSVFALTPDGPKGPAKVVQFGTVHMARKSGCPVIPVGVACSRAKRLHSWDRHMIPMPFAKAALVFGKPVYVPSDESISDEEMSKQIEDAMNAAESEAEQMLLEGKQ